MNCRHAQEEIAVALLGHGSLGEDAMAHLQTCPDCAAEQASLRQVSSLMAQVPASAAGATDLPLANDQHLQRILAAVSAQRGQRRRRTIVRGLVAAAVLFVVAIGIGVGAVALAPHGHEITASASAAGLWALADIEPAGDGSQLTISAKGLPEDTECVLSVHTRDGRTEPVLTWWAEYDDTAHVVTTSKAEPDAISAVTLSTSDGVTLLEIPVRS